MVITFAQSHIQLLGLWYAHVEYTNYNLYKPVTSFSMIHTHFPSSRIMNEVSWCIQVAALENYICWVPHKGLVFLSARGFMEMWWILECLMYQMSFMLICCCCCFGEYILNMFLYSVKGYNILMIKGNMIHAVAVWPIVLNINHFLWYEAFENKL